MLVGDEVTVFARKAGIRAKAQGHLPLRHSAGIEPDFPRCFKPATTARSLRVSGEYQGLKGWRVEVLEGRRDLIYDFRLRTFADCRFRGEIKIDFAR